MKKNKLLVVFLICVAVLTMVSCAQAPEEKVYSTEPDAKYEIKYLLTDFEQRTNWNAETIERDAGAGGYHYMFEDPKSELDYSEPHAAKSPQCKESPAPKKCSVVTGIQANQANPLPYFDSILSFHMTGRTAGEGVGFGTYFRDMNPFEPYVLENPGMESPKEPRDLGGMGQEGFVFWATGNATVQVSLNVPTTTPLTDGGLCDEEGGEKCYDFHKVTFKLDGAWREYHAVWDEFQQEGWGVPAILEPNAIINIQIKVVAPETGGAKDFDIWIDQLGFYGGSIWEFTENLKGLDLDNDTASDSDTGESPQDTGSSEESTDSGTDTDSTTE